MSNRSWFRLTVIPPVFYAAAILLAAGYVIYRDRFAPRNSEFAGVPLVLLTLPWSLTFPTTHLNIVEWRALNSVLLPLGYGALNIGLFEMLLLAVRAISGTGTKGDK